MSYSDTSSFICKLTEIGAAIVSGAFVYLAMQAKKNSELKVEIFTRLNRLEQVTARLEERCPMKNTR
jgi:hypothetical protein|tara:strand:- start:251 stop:451 length:201 start_codon:yes stop_codon:yes gene_type:complete